MQIEQISKLTCSERIARLKEEMLEEPRFASIEQARIDTESYQEKGNLAVFKGQRL